jgi:hydroxyacylglutathione hydrolase
VEIEAILLTHCHFDHIGAVAPVARATGAPVYCPRIERPILADVMSWVPPGFGPFESYEADHTLAGGERLHLAGLDFDVTSPPATAPGTSPTRSTARCSPATCCSRDQSDASTCPAGTGPRSSARSRLLLENHPPETVVYPGHMGVTTLGRERDTNPFLSELRVRVPRVARPRPTRPCAG